MFIRIKNSGKYKYLQIVESSRTYGGVVQKTIASLGRLDLFTKGTTLLELGHHFINLYEKLQQKPAPRRKKKKAA